MSHVYDDVLFELVEYMSEHFLHEEKLMHCLSSALVQAHKHEHAELSSRVVALMPSAKKAKAADVRRDNLADVISQWLREHIQEWDMPLAQALGAERK
jgi:hemerythrin-like metal-binding protein